MDQLEAIHQREHKRSTLVARKKNWADIGKEANHCFQCCNVIQIARLVFYKAMDPTLHYKMKAEEVYDGYGNWFANSAWIPKTGMCTQKINSDARPDVNLGVFTDTIRTQRPEASVYRSRGLCIQRTPMQTRRQKKQKQKQKQTAVNDDREHRDVCTNWVKTKERWTTLRPHDDWIMTAMSKARALQEQGAKQEQHAKQNFAKTDWSHYLANDFESPIKGPMTREDDGDGADAFFRTRLCLYIELFGQESVGRTDEFCVWFLWILPRLTRESSIKRYNLRERKSVKIHACCQQWRVHARCAFLHNHFETDSARCKKLTQCLSVHSLDQV